MARRKQMDAIDAKIARTKDSIIRAKARYDAKMAQLETLEAKKDEVLKDRLFKAYKASGKTFRQVMIFLGG
jgi:hypothetical protein